MPRSHSVREAINENVLYAALRAATQGYGGVVRFARKVGISREYVHGMQAGNRRVSAEVAGKLGYELRWMRKNE